jgi:hypothetical protein
MSGDSTDLLGQGLFRLAGKRRSWAKMTPEERKQWRLMGEMVRDFALERWPDLYACKHRKRSYDTAEVQAANGHMELASAVYRVTRIGGGTVEQRRTINAKASPLSHYAARQVITRPEWAAGDWLYEQHVKAGRSGPAAAPMDGGGTGGGGIGFTEAQIYHAELLEAARKAMLAHKTPLWSVLESVVLQEMTAKAWAIQAGFTARTASAGGVQTLRAALQALKAWKDEAVTRDDEPLDIDDVLSQMEG